MSITYWETDTNQIMSERDFHSNNAGAFKPSPTSVSQEPKAKRKGEEKEAAWGEKHFK